MTFEKFIVEIKKKVEEKLGNGFRLRFEEREENGNPSHRALCITKDGDHISACINLQIAYMEYTCMSEQCSLDDVAERIVKTFNDSPVPDKARAVIENIEDYEKIKDRIIYRLINTESNMDMLRDIPNIPFLDLSIIFSIYLGSLNEGEMLMKVTNQYMELLDISVDDLLEEADKNTPRLLPAYLENIEEIIRDMGNSEGAILEYGDSSFSMFVMTNRQKHNGASVILYPGLLQEYSEKLGGDILILPSSVHELILLPWKGDCDVNEIAGIIQQINAAEVPNGEVLSDHPYLYHEGRVNSLIGKSYDAPFS